MSTTEPRARADRDRAPDGASRGADSSLSWVMFAATMMGLVSVMNFIYGIAAVSNSSFFVGDAKFVLGGLNSLGWLLLIVALTQLLTSLGIAGGVSFARWLGVGLALVNALVQMLLLPAYPWWSLTAFVLDIFVVYALVVHGGR